MQVADKTFHRPKKTSGIYWAEISDFWNMRQARLGTININGSYVDQ